VCLSACIDDVAAWMLANRLQLNTGKIDLLWCATARRRHQLPTSALGIGSDFVNSSTSVRNLGIYFDADLSVRCHVQRTVASCFSVLRQLRSIRRSHVQYKLATVMCRSLNGTAPSYLAADLRRLSDMPSRRRLRSSLTHQLDVRQSQCATVGDRAFTTAGAPL